MAKLAECLAEAGFVIVGLGMERDKATAVEVWNISAMKAEMFEYDRGSYSSLPR